MDLLRRWRGTLVAGAAGALLGALVLGYWLIFHAPVYRLMTHAPRDLSTLFPERPAVVAHRGWSGIAPENTVAAFRAAAAGGFHVELDVTLSADGEVVVIHDDTLDRTTDGTGDVLTRPWAELAGLDAGGWFGPEFAGEPLPTLASALAAIPPDRVVLVEMKRQDDKQALPRAVARVLAETGRRDRVMVISFDPFLLETLRLTDPEVFRGQLVGDYAESDLAWYEKRALQNLVFTPQVQQDAVLWQHDMLDEALVAQMKGLGYPVFTWTVDEPADIARMQTLGIDGIISNHPDRVR